MTFTFQLIHAVHTHGIHMVYIRITYAQSEPCNFVFEFECIFEGRELKNSQLDDKRTSATFF